jgi:hydroxymethylglutaryl-CoA reductase
MGANMVNTVAESLAERVAALGGGGLRILTNLGDRRRVSGARARWRARDGGHGRRAVVTASSPRRASPRTIPSRRDTQKGIMNGVDAVVIATGNDWRGVEGGARLRR